MKTSILFIVFNVLATAFLYAQELVATEKQKQDIQTLIDAYTRSREQKDTALLTSILTNDIDQLVSSGTWRKGKEESMKGMLRSSQNNPGKRTITVEHIRLLNQGCAIVDARYEIINADGTARRMWSSFIVVRVEELWKISAIRNMLPAG